MRATSSSKQGKERKMETEKLKEQEPHLSGAYIRSLVKQLSHNSTNKDSSNTQNIGDETQQSEPPKQHKKQVRRRLHTTRPYQERLLNMAEARREIVTALKFHRASMKQQQQQQQTPQVQEVQPLQPTVPPDAQRQPRINQRNISASNFSFHPPPCNPDHTYSAEENFMNFGLPNQPLGLNLNLQDFNNIETSIYSSSNCPSIYSSSPSPSSTSSPPISYSSAESFPSMASSSSSSVVADYGDFNQGETGMHTRMDDKEIAEIRSIGDQHQMELNDTLNLVSSAWWCKFLKAMEFSGNGEKSEDEYGNHPFDEIMEFPDWLSSNESCLQQHLQDYYSDDYFKDPSLPW